MNEQMPMQHLDNRGNVWMDADRAAEAKVKHAAENGKWTKWAQPGFEESAEQIGIDARNEADEQDTVPAGTLPIAIEQRSQAAQEIPVRVE